MNHLPHDYSSPSLKADALRVWASRFDLIAFAETQTLHAPAFLDLLSGWCLLSFIFPPSLHRCPGQGLLVFCRSSMLRFIEDVREVSGAQCVLVFISGDVCGVAFPVCCSFIYRSPSDDGSFFGRLLEAIPPLVSHPARNAGLCILGN